MERVITHDGVFHADEVFAIALWKKYVNSNIEIIRTRDTDMQADMFIDIGGVYSPDELLFDHHQLSYKGDLSSVGMIAKYITDGGIDIPDRILILVKELDDNDTGKQRSDSRIVRTIRELNSPDIFGSDQKWNFEMALSYARLVLLDLSDQDIDATNDEIGYAVLVGDRNNRNPIIEAIHNNKRRINELNEEIDNTISRYEQEEGIIVFHRKEVFIPVSKLIGKADICVQFDQRQNCWSVQCIPLKENSFSTKLSLKSTKLSSEIFLHKTGFIGKYKEQSNNTITINIDGNFKNINVGEISWKL